MRSLIIGGSFLAILLIGFALIQKEDFESTEMISAGQSFADFSTRLAPPKVRAGEEVRAIIDVKVKKGWHIYSVVPSDEEFAIPPTSFDWKKNDLAIKGPVYETNPLSEFVPVLDMVLSFHEIRAKFYQNFKVPEKINPGEYKIEGSIKYQTCNDKLCLPPRVYKIDLPFQVERGPTRPAYRFMDRAIDELPKDASFLPSAENLDSALSEGWISFLILAVVMGVLSWFTPCVFPMIPITISYFSKQAENQKGNLVVLAFIFSSGIIVTYTGVGLILASVFGAASIAQFATNPWVNIGIAVIFTIFAFSLIGLFEFRMPANWVQKADEISRKQGNSYIGTLLMGMTFTLTAFTCTVQFAGTLLIAAAQGEWIWPIMGMLVFSSVFSLPFFLLALFPKWSTRFRSKSGHWMIRLKALLGIVELMVVVKFVSNADLIWQTGVLTRPIVLSIWSVLALLGAIMIVGLFHRNEGHNIPITSPSWLIGGMFLVLSVYFVTGVSGKDLDGLTESYLPPDLGSQRYIQTAIGNSSYQSQDKVHELPWNPILKPALEQAKRENKPVFIDFTGYTCINCRWMEKNVFAEDEVFTHLKEHFVLARLYTDGGDYAEENQKLQIERFKTIALPFYVILTPDNTTLAKRSGISNPRQFSDFLQIGISSNLKSTNRI